MTAPTRIVAVAARTPIGLTAKSSAASARARLSRLATHPFMVDGMGHPLICARDGLLDEVLSGPARLTALAGAALEEVALKLPALGEMRQPPRVLLALPETRPGFSEDDAAKVVEGLGMVFRPSKAPPRFEVAARGHAGALHALSVANQRIHQGAEDLCIVLGVDGYLEADTLDWLAAHRQLAGEGVRTGFFPGEAAGALVVTRASVQERSGWPLLASLRGTGTAVEARGLHGDAEVLGEGLSQAILEAATSLRLPEERLDAVYCDINGERYRTEEWGFAVLRTQQLLRDSAYISPVDCWGEVGAASGALSCVLATQSWARGYASGPRALIWGSSEGGLRAAAVLEAGPSRRKP
ncbi:hypothetical protein NVS55_01295 [Myxococcus stipitatus]|uniref:hypothetical protein n=1 Tax=Myxococcus stipitatus TaxID=83455 RepID=UPI0031453DBD